MTAPQTYKSGRTASSRGRRWGGAARAAACAGDACLIERLIKAGLPRRVADDGRTARPPARGRQRSRRSWLGADVKKADRQGRNARNRARRGYCDLEAGDSTPPAALLVRTRELA